MDFVVKTIISEYSAELEGYHALLLARLMNLCVKANPYSLLPVVVEVDEQQRVFEEVADVSIPDDDHLDVYPKLEENLFIIGKGVLEVHPEFKMSEESFKHGDDDIRYLRFTMPKVDKDRRDVLTQGVDVFYKETKSQLDQTKVKYEPRLAEKLTKLSPQEADEAKQKFNGTYDAVVKMTDDLVNDKNQEIEEAYQRYLQQKDAADKTMQEQQAAQGDDVKNKLTFPS